jgi:hypothetical protein
MAKMKNIIAVLLMAVLYAACGKSIWAENCFDIIGLTPPYEQCRWTAKIEREEDGQKQVIDAHFYYSCGKYRVEENSGGVDKVYILKDGKIYIPNYSSNTVFADSAAEYTRYLGKLLPFVVNGKKKEGASKSALLGITVCEKTNYAVLRQSSSMYLKAKLTEWRYAKNGFVKEMQIKAPKHELDFAGSKITAGPLAEKYKMKKLVKTKLKPELFDIPAGMKVYDIAAEYSKRAAQRGINIKSEGTVKFKAGKK